MSGEQNASADGSAHGCRRGRSPIRASLRVGEAAPPLAALLHPPPGICPTRHYITRRVRRSHRLDCVKARSGRSASCLPARQQHSAAAPRRSSEQDLKPDRAAFCRRGLEGLSRGGNLSPEVMRTHPERISLVRCQKHLERITQGSTPPPEQQRIIHISDVPVLQLCGC